MDWREIYESRLMSVEEAASLVSSGDRIFIGGGGSTPAALVNAVCARRDIRDVRVISANGGTDMACLSDPDCFSRVGTVSFFLGTADRAGLPLGNVEPASVHFHRALRAVKDVYRANVHMVEVTEPDEEGYLYFGVRGVCWSPAAHWCEKRVYQINAHQQRTAGKCSRIHVSEVTALCRCDHELSRHNYKTSPWDELIAEQVAPLVRDGDTLQIGFGGLPNAIAYRLTDRKSLGIRSEVVTDSMLELMRRGVVDRERVEAGFVITATGRVDEELLPFIKLAPINEINDPFEVGRIENFVSVNSCLMCDLTGQVCSENILGRQYSGTGGQVDFVRAAALSKGGRSVLCLKSTHSRRDGTLESSIRAALPEGAVVTTPRTDVMYIATEYGVAELFDQTLEERAYRLINIAHPAFRGPLFDEAVERGIIRRAKADHGRIDFRADAK